MSAKKRVRKRRLYKATILVVSFILLFTATGFTGVKDSHAAPLNNKVYRGDIVIPFDEGFVSRELPQHRGEYEKHFLNTDGTVTAYSYANPIHYLDANGNWQDIDNTLIKSTEGFTNTDNPNKIQLSYTARNEGLASVKLERYEVSWGIQGINNTEGYEVEKQEAIDRRNLVNLTSKVKYDNVFENTSLVYTLSSYSLSEDLVFDSLPNFDQVTYQIQTTNLIATLEGSEVIFTSTTEEGKEIFRFQAPYLCDSAFKLTYDITVILNTVEGGYTLTYILDRTWLQSEERVYPITLDPTITSYQHYSNIEDTHINDWNPNTNYMNASYLNIGNVNGRNDIWIKITTLPTLPLGAPIVDARLEMTHSLGTTTWGAFEIWELTSEWHSSTLTWNNQWNCSWNYLQGGIYPYWNASLGAYAYSIDVTSTVKKWYNDPTTNWGFALNYENIYYNDYNTLYSSDHGSIGSSYLPAISVTYVVLALHTHPAAWTWFITGFPSPTHTAGQGHLVDVVCSYCGLQNTVYVPLGGCSTCNMPLKSLSMKVLMDDALVNYGYTTVDIHYYVRMAMYPWRCSWNIEFPTLHVVVAPSNLPVNQCGKPYYWDECSPPECSSSCSSHDKNAAVNLSWMNANNANGVNKLAYALTGANLCGVYPSSHNGNVAGMVLKSSPQFGISEFVPFGYYFNERLAIRVMQHEMSHMFGVPDNGNGYSCTSGQMCIMLYSGVLNSLHDDYDLTRQNIWCDNCQAQFNRNAF